MSSSYTAEAALRRRSPDAASRLPRAHRRAATRQAGARLRRGRAHLRRDQRARRATRRAARKPRRAPRRSRRRVHGQLGGRGDRDLRSTQGRRGVHAGQRAHQERQARLHAERCARRCAHHPFVAAHGVGPGARARLERAYLHLDGRGRRLICRQRLARGADRPGPRRHHLHLGIDRRAQGRDALAPKRARVRGVGGHHLRSLAGGPAREPRAAPLRSRDLRPPRDRALLRRRGHTRRQRRQVRHGNG